MGILLACMPMHYCACLVPASQKRASGPPVLELQMAASCYVSIGN